MHRREFIALVAGGVVVSSGAAQQADRAMHRELDGYCRT
jgi:hypothetical protein